MGSVARQVAREPSGSETTRAEGAFQAISVHNYSILYDIKARPRKKNLLGFYIG